MTYNTDTEKYATAVWICTLASALLVYSFIFWLAEKKINKKEEVSLAAATPAIELPGVGAHQGEVINEMQLKEEQAAGRLESGDSGVGAAAAAAASTTTTGSSQPRESTTAQAASVSAPAPVELIGSRFGKGRDQEDAVELVFHHHRRNTFYSVSLDKESIQCTSLWSRHGIELAVALDGTDDGAQGDPNKGQDTGLFEQQVATADFECETKTVPLSVFSHIEGYATASLPNFWAIQWRRLLSFVCFVQRNLIFLLGLLFLVALIACFYIPGTNDTDTEGDTRGQDSYRLTVCIFVLTLVCFVLHLVVLGLHTKQHDRAVKGQVIAWRVLLIGLPFLIICLALSANLYQIADVRQRKHNSSNSTSGGRSKSDAAKLFECGCVDGAENRTAHPSSAPSTLYPSHQPTYTEIPTFKPSFFGIPSEAPTENPSAEPSEAPSDAPIFTPTLAPTGNTSQPFNCPTSYPSTSPTSFPTKQPKPTKPPQPSDEYEFQCTEELYWAAGTTTCQMNCGVCGDTYRNPFLAYTAMGTLYVLTLLYLIFYQLFFAFLLPPILLPPFAAAQTQTHIVVTIHGSHAFGYPLYTHLNLKEYLKLVALLTTHTAQQRQQLDKQPPDFLRHMAMSNSNDLSRVKMGVSTVSTAVFKFAWFVIRTAIRVLTGVPV